MDDTDLAGRVEQMRLQVAAERTATQALHRASRDLRRSSRETGAWASAAVDTATTVLLRRAGVRDAHPPVPSYLPDDLQSP